MIETSEVSLNSETQVLASAGSTRMRGLRQHDLRSACCGLMPSASAAFHCPRRIDWMPARNVSELNAETLRLSPTSAVVKSENVMSNAAGST